MTINDLKAYGANTSEGLKRCMDNEELYIRLVKMVSEDTHFQDLYDSIESGDLQEAFDVAHALKGALQNLELTPLAGPVKEITELLRNRTECDYTELIETITKELEKLKQICI